MRGLAKGIGSVDKVTSPTFTVKQEYYTQDLTLHHFDFYRLHEPGIIAGELHEVIHQRDGVIVIEWAKIVEGALPRVRMTVHLKTTGETTREIEFSYPDSLKYLLEGVG